MKKIKVLVIVNAKFGYDGISSVAMNYYKYRDKERVQMDMLTINPVFGDFAKIIDDNGDKRFVVENRNRSPLSYIFRLKSIIKENGYDIVHVHGNSATMAVELMAAKLAGCRVRIAHSHNTKCDHNKLNKMLMPVFSRLYTDCCACSVEAGEFLFGKRECFVVNNGLYLPKYEYDESKRELIRKKLGIEDKYVIGHIGRFCCQKNQEYLVYLLKGIIQRKKNAVLLLVGAGETEEEIKNQVISSGLGESVIFYGTSDHVNEVVQAMDIFAFPSRFEGLGIVAVEAQASGLNCVASDAVPKTITVQDKVVFLPLSGHDDEWIENIISLGVSPDERIVSKDSTMSRLREKGFDIEQNCSDLLGYYEKILSGR